MGINGAQGLSKVPIGAATRGFFDLFYRLNTAGACCVVTSRPTPRKPRSFPQESRARRTYSTAPSASPSVTSTPTPSLTLNPEPAISTTLRHLMRTLPHSVVVLTTTSSHPHTYLHPHTNTSSPPSPSSNPNPNSKPRATTIQHERKGMTLSSFTTLTLTPTPIITFNIRKPSQTLSALMETRWFLIHILSGTVEGARVADRFTRGNRRSLWEGLGVEDINIGEGLLGEMEQRIRLPRIESQGVGRVLLCEVEGGQNGGGFVEVGDHVVVVAGVREILPASARAFFGSSGTAKGEVPFGLCYVDGAYRGIGGAIDLTVKDEQRRGEGAEA